MALQPLATAADLDARGVDTSNAAKVTAMLAAASAAVRDAAGTSITLEVSTVKVPGSPHEFLDLPGPVRAVTSVVVDGTAVTDYTVVGNQLWRYGGWQAFRSGDTGFYLPSVYARPVMVEVTYEHGYDEVPADIVNLVCDLATAGLLAEGPRDPRVTSEAVDDYRVSYAAGADAAASLFELPEGTRAWLRQRFSAQAYVTGAGR